MIEGQTVNMGGKEFIVPPLNFKRLKLLKNKLKVLSTADPTTTTSLSEPQLDACISIIHSALTRNYPDLEKDEMESLLDFGNMPVVLAAVMGQSGFVRSGE
jgi:hypothetical protein